MRTKLLSTLLIISFVLGSFPFAQAQEVPEPEPQPEVVEAVPAVDPLPEPEPLVEPVEAEPEPEPVIEEPITPTEPEPLAEESFAKMAAPELLEVTEEEPASVSLTVRYGEDVAWSGTVPLPEDGTVSVTPTGESTGVDVTADSLLAVLLAVDSESDDFEVSDLDYYSSFGSFIVNCIDAPGFGHACGQWQYVIDGNYPFVGIDDYTLDDGDQIYIYFGNPRRAVLGDTDITVNETFTATAQSYDPATNEYSPLPGYTIGITQPDPSDPWSPIEVATSTSGTDGTATFALAAEGTYDIGLKEDFYFPSTSFAVSSTTGSGSGSGSGDETVTGFDFAAAYDFLESGQNSDGSWDTDITTDWTAVALGISGAPSSMKSSLAAYLRNEDADLDTALDYERHAMALMALGINPYTGGPDDYISPIVDKFDGEQMDDPDLVNDDAFAIITLMNAGFTKDDGIIKDMAAFIVAEQNRDGSWTGGVDVSGAYIQALKLVSSLPGVSSALGKAQSYMKSEQNSDGGFGSPSDAYATSWALQGIEALGSSAASWKQGENTPLTYLIDNQDEDGGMEADKDYDLRAWATAYAIPAAKGLTWAEILKNFKKSEDVSDGGDKDTDDDAATTTDETVAVLPQEEPLIPPYFATSTDAVLAENVPVPAAVVNAPKLAITDEVVDEPDIPVEPAPSDLTAAALDSGTWDHIKGLFSSFWSFLKNLVT